MKIFMVEVQLPYEPGIEFFSLIPAQRQKVGELLAKRKFVSYTLSADRAKIWIIANGDSEQDVQETLDQQPMSHFFTYTFHELMFHEIAGTMFPALSLN